MMLMQFKCPQVSEAPPPLPVVWRGVLPGLLSVPPAAAAEIPAAAAPERVPALRRPVGTSAALPGW